MRNVDIPGLEVRDLLVQCLALLLPACLGTGKLRLRSFSCGATFSRRCLTLRQTLLQVLDRLQRFSVGNHLPRVAVLRSLYLKLAMVAV